MTCLVTGGSESASCTKMPSRRVPTSSTPLTTSSTRSARRVKSTTHTAESVPSASRTAESLAVSPSSPISTPPFDFVKFRRAFDRAYDQFYRKNHVEQEILDEINQHAISMDQFDKLTLGKQYQRYISLIDGKIRFDEIPNRPHGELVSLIQVLLSREFQELSGNEVLIGCADNGMILFINVSDGIDLPLNVSTKRRPDASFRLDQERLPNPPPNWIVYLPNGLPTPNVVVEISVNNEGPQRLMEDADRYFSPLASTRVWIGVKVWLREKKFWVGWAERHASGTPATIHTVMNWPPNHHPWTTPVNHIYQIPMLTIYGPGVPQPPNTPTTLDIDCDMIRRRIRKCNL